MRHALTLAIVALSALLTVRLRGVEPAAPLPSAVELHTLFTDKNYPELLQKLNRVLQLRGDAARPYDRVDLYLLKADTHLQLKEQSLAATALEAAVKEIDEGTPPRQAAVARTTQQVLKRSRGWAYTPRNAPADQAVKSIDVIDPSKRAEIFASMFDDEKAGIAAKVRVAKESRTLGPVIDAVKAVGELRQLEMAAFGKQEQSGELLDDLAGNARDLMAAALKDSRTAASRIDARANQSLRVNLEGSIGFGQGSSPLYHKRGLDAPGRKELKGIIGDCERIADAARQFAGVSKSTAASLDEVRGAADDLASDAQDTLDADYGGIFGD